MSAFADSSALVKLYAPENGSDAARGLEITFVSAIAAVEVAAALWRKRRLGELDARATGELVANFETDLAGSEGERPLFVQVAVSAEIVRAAARLSAAFPLRAYDCVQLASAVAAREADPSCDRFACYDDDLRAAAAANAFALAP